MTTDQTAEARRRALDLFHRFFPDGSPFLDGFRDAIAIALVEAADDKLAPKTREAGFYPVLHDGQWTIAKFDPVLNDWFLPSMSGTFHEEFAAIGPRIIFPEGDDTR